MATSIESLIGYLDEEDLKAIPRLFADIGDSYVELIYTGSAESLLIVQALIDVASNPEYYIASMTFNFWNNLQLNLTERESNLSFEAEASIEAERNRGYGYFVYLMSHLYLWLSLRVEVSIVQASFRVQYPHNYGNISREDRGEFKQIVGDVLIDVAP